jgi:hypothetical protein
MADNLDNLVNARNGGEGSNEKKFLPSSCSGKVVGARRNGMYFKTVHAA